MTPSRRALRVTLVYLAFGAAWIVLTDLYVDWLELDGASLTRLQTVKGLTYVVVTAVVFFMLVRRELVRQAEADTEARRREQTLQAMFEATFQHAAVGMAHSSADGRFLRVNRAYCEMVGYSQDELSEMGYQDITHPDDLAADEAQRNRMMAGEIDSFNLDKRFLRKDGTTVWASLTSSVVPDARTGTRYYLAVINDISDRKFAEQALRHSESRFRALVEQSITGVYMFDQSTFRYVNKRLAQMFGYSEDELIDRLGPLDLIAPEDQGTVRAQMERRLEGKVRSAHYIARGLRKDGTRIWLELHGTRMDLEGQPLVTGTALDITERVEAEQRLKDSEARFRAIYEGANDAILLLDPGSGTILDLNRRAEKMLGCGVEEARQLGLADFSTGGPAPAWPAVDDRVRAASGGEPQMFEWQARDRQGRPFWVEINMQSARIGDVDRIMVLARDITARRASEESRG